MRFYKIKHSFWYWSKHKFKNSWGVSREEIQNYLGYITWNNIIRVCVKIFEESIEDRYTFLFWIFIEKQLIYLRSHSWQHISCNHWYFVTPDFVVRWSWRYEKINNLNGGLGSKHWLKGWIISFKPLKNEFLLKCLEDS